MVGEEEDEGEGGAPARAAAVRLPSVLVLGRLEEEELGVGAVSWYRFGGFREISYLQTSECFPARFARARVGSELGL